jgi:hypothetical protein
MIIGAGILVFMAICALSLVGLGESHSRVSRILNELDDNRLKEASESRAPAIMQAQKIEDSSDVFAEVGFTRSLLALSKVDSRDPYNCPVPERVESSSLVSVRRAQSRSLGPISESA